jgi:hypothetical protein
MKEGVIFRSIHISGFKCFWGLLIEFDQKSVTNAFLVL